MAVTPEQRGTFGRWLVSERKARGWKADELRDRLREARGFGLGHSTYALLESGQRKPTEEQRRHLTAFLGSEPDPDPGEPGGLQLLVAAIERQTDAIAELAAAIRDDRDRVSLEGVRTFLAQLRAEGLLVEPSALDTLPTDAGHRPPANHGRGEG